MPTGTVHHDDDPGSENKNIGYVREPKVHRTHNEFGELVSVIVYKPFLQTGNHSFGQDLKKGAPLRYELRPYYLDRVEDEDLDADGLPSSDKRWIFIAENQE